MNIPHRGLSVDIEMRNIIEITSLELKQELNHHGKLSITCLIDDDRLEEFFVDTVAESKVKLFHGEKVIFCGYLSFVEVFADGGQWMSIMEFSSMSGKMDICKKSRVFSEQNDKYIDVIEKVLKQYPGGTVWDEITREKSIPGLLLQYEETDWQFLVRLASHFSSFLVAVSTNEKTGIYFGVPELDSHDMLNERDYIIIQDKECFGQNIQSHDFEFDRWKINSSRYFKVGDRVLFHGVLTIVVDVNIFEKNGELIREYTLQQKEGLKTSRKYNFEVLGISLPATVVDRKENKVQVEFDINQPYPPETSSKFFVYGIESSSFYCIPEKGSRVHIYFPGRFESDAMAIHALNIGDGALRSPSNKTFSSPSGAEMNMTPSNYNFKSDSAEASVLNLGADGTISFTGTNITVDALNLISLGISENGNTPEIVSCAKTEQIISASGSDSSIMMSSENHIVSEIIRMKAESGDLSAEAEVIRAQLTEADEQLLEDYNNKQREKLKKSNPVQETPSVEDVSDIAVEESKDEEEFGVWKFNYRDDDENSKDYGGTLLSQSEDENVDFSTPSPRYWGTSGATKAENDREIAEADGGYQGLINFGVKGRYDAAFRQDKGDYAKSKVRLGSVYGGFSGSLGSFKKDGAKWYEFWELEEVGAGISAKIGVSAVDAEATARLLGIDNEIVNVNVGGQVSVLKAEANADIGAGMVNGEYKLSAEAGAGAYLAEGEVSGGVTLVGVDVNAKASGKVGIGAEAKAGYANGKFKVKAGVAVLLGGSVEAEIDISDISAGWNQVCGWWDNLW